MAAIVLSTFSVTMTPGAAGSAAGPSTTSRATGSDSPRVTAPVSCRQLPCADGGVISLGAVGLKPARSSAAPKKCPAGSRPSGVGCIDKHPVSITYCPSARKAVKFYAGRIAYWQERMAIIPRAMRQKYSGCPRYLAHVLQRKAQAAHKAFIHWERERRAHFRRLYEKWRCIHEHEGAWNANTGNGYWGGLQMTRWFQQTYGPEFYRRWGTADRWPVWAQLTAAERAYQSDGDYGQWGTARMCGLPT